jgi:hypothetical protein
MLLYSVIYFTLKIKAAGSIETSVIMYQTTRAQAERVGSDGKVSDLCLGISSFWKICRYTDYPENIQGFLPPVKGNAGIET